MFSLTDECFMNNMHHSMIMLRLHAFEQISVICIYVNFYIGFIKGKIQFLTLTGLYREIGGNIILGRCLPLK